MTRLLHIFTTFLITNICFGQPDSIPTSTNKIILGANAGLLITKNILNSYASYVREKEVLNYHTSCTIEKGKSIFSVGSIFSPHLEKKNDKDHNKERGQYGLNGLQISYQFNIRPNAKTFNSFFQTHFIYSYYKNIGEVYKSIPYGGGGNIKYTSRWTVKYFFISYGLSIKLPRNFYISPYAGIGYILDMEYVYYDQGGEYFNYDYRDTRLSLIISLSLGYKLGHKN